MQTFVVCAHEIPPKSKAILQWDSVLVAFRYPKFVLQKFPILVEAKR